MAHSRRDRPCLWGQKWSRDPRMQCEDLDKELADEKARLAAEQSEEEEADAF